MTVLHDLGLNVKYYSNSDVEPFLDGELFIRKHFGNDAEKILKMTDLPVFVESIRKLKKYHLFEKKKLSFEEIKFHIEQGHVPLMLVDYNKIVGKEGLYQGHFLVVTGFDSSHIFFHESGPENAEANKKIQQSIFLEAWDANGTDNDVVIVFGKR